MVASRARRTGVFAMRGLSWPQARQWAPWDLMIATVSESEALALSEPRLLLDSCNVQSRFGAEDGGTSIQPATSDPASTPQNWLNRVSELSVPFAWGGADLLKLVFFLLFPRFLRKVDTKQHLGCVLPNWPWSLLKLPALLTGCTCGGCIRGNRRSFTLRPPLRSPANL